MAAVFSAIAALAFAPSVPANILVGAGGCDVSDRQCVAPAMPFSDQIVALSNGNLHNYTAAGSPSWIHKVDGCVFAALTSASQVASYRLQADGTLSAVSSEPSMGMFPVKLDSRGSVLIVANYGGTTGATVTTFLFDQQSCSLNTAGSTMPFQRHSIDPLRQANSHVHTVVVDKAASTSQSFQVLAADLGGDVVYTLSVEQINGAINLLHTSLMKPGSGPRHIAIHPTLRIAYVVHEMANELSVHGIDGSSGALIPLQTLSTVPSASPLPKCTGLSEEQTMCSKAAEIAITGNGDSVFVSNRGFGSPNTNSISGYKVLMNGTVEFVQLAPSLTRYPRGMVLTPNSSQLLVAGQGSGNLVGFALGQAGTVRLPGVQLAAGLATPTTVVSF